MAGEDRPQGRMALNPNDNILVAVLNANDGQPLSPNAVHRTAVEQHRYPLSAEKVRQRLRQLAADGYIGAHPGPSGDPAYVRLHRNERLDA